MKPQVTELKDKIAKSVKSKTKEISHTVADQAKASQRKLSTKALEASYALDKAAEKVQSEGLKSGLQRTSERVLEVADTIDHTTPQSALKAAKRISHEHPLLVAGGGFLLGLMASALLTSSTNRPEIQEVEPIEVPAAVEELEEYLDT